jgi:hypothetical protein
MAATEFEQQHNSPGAAGARMVVAVKPSPATITALPCPPPGMADRQNIKKNSLAMTIDHRPAQLRRNGRMSARSPALQPANWFRHY